MMKAARVAEYGKPYELVNVSVPTPKSHEVLIKIKAAGYCHTDELVKNGVFGSPTPLIGSHEGAGIIQALGDDVSGKLAVGDRVAALLYRDPCGKCPDCKDGQQTYCDNIKMNGFQTDGAFAEYMIADARFVLHLPPGVDFEQGASLMCAGATIYTGLVKANLSQGDVVGIQGVGALGNLGIQFAKAMGYGCIAIDVRKPPLELAMSMGLLSADLALNYDDGTDVAIEAIKSEFPTRTFPGVDAMLVTSGGPETFDYAAKVTKKHGTVVALSCADEDIIGFDWKDFVFRDIKVVGGLVSTYQDAVNLVALADARGIKIKVQSYPLEEINKLFDEWHSVSVG
ncbi:hypothetical protein C361_01934 [Cryptococcus neoformans Tu259-1]|uniref:Enoyl reductase (ER) domain-containing protein n=1 Tax=Cryptococcus neoformans Tu259-1 TaxID=1230072 RepID=A0A854QGN7_CRYNE|nr:hypothetical protein C353_06212 [Cryptococcus neoformans var. grubii AD1-83a]OXG24934.1 hypothetical protein C361_01934 [Cryptococcus neoformans var. grubii Tu259-1]OXG36852.1 hypothetical protein C360_01975 [Cryptococcus neoformans var. grubii Bt15]OXG47882.1 hypothetical protein C354_06199 [Cryptococcus neoformans var. grubii MW-RSA1955]OXG51352.1 hypothetical protein C352_06222 [Cryptococcus neoformans var. grubii CHC193]OXG57855.1 hypothetical protein C351_06298 [Cryptococcus neoformans